MDETRNFVWAIKALFSANLYQISDKTVLILTMCDRKATKKTHTHRRNKKLITGYGIRLQQILLPLIEL